MMAKAYKLLTLLALVGLSNAALADSSYDRENASNEAAPRAVLVRVGSNQDVSVFKATELSTAIKGNAKATESAIDRVATEANLVSHVNPIDLTKKTTEFDRDKATQSWCYYYYGTYWAPTTYFNYYYNTYAAYAYNWAYAYYYRGYNWYWYW